jgi:hypothetical protein
MVGSDARVPRTARADGGAKDEAAMETAEIIPERVVSGQLPIGLFVSTSRSGFHKRGYI